MEVCGGWGCASVRVLMLVLVLVGAVHGAGAGCALVRCSRVCGVER